MDWQQEWEVTISNICWLEAASIGMQPTEHVFLSTSVGFDLFGGSSLCYWPPLKSEDPMVFVGKNEILRPTSYLDVCDSPLSLGFNQLSQRWPPIRVYYWLVVWNMNVIFHFIYGMSSFPLTNSYFSRWLKHVKTTNQITLLQTFQPPTITHQGLLNIYILRGFFGLFPWTSTTWSLHVCTSKMSRVDYPLVI